MSMTKYEATKQAFWDSERARQERCKANEFYTLPELDDIQAEAFLASLRESGWTMARVEPTPEIIAAALPLAKGAPSQSAKRVGAAACLLLTGGKDVACEGEAVVSAAQLVDDYRAMLAAQEEDDGK